MLDIPAAETPETAGPRRDRGRPEAAILLVALGASILLHLVAVGVGMLRPSPRSVPPAEQAIRVDLLSPDQLAALTAPPRPVIAPAPEPEAEPAALPPEPPEPDVAPPARSAMVRPTGMLSARELADPRSAEARAMLPRLDDTDRMIQLCGIEAMAQVHAWRETFRPDRIVAYAGAEVAVSGDVVNAGEAAFRSGPDWYALAYECQLAPDHATVTAFAFAVGAIVPPREWEARNLPDPAIDRD